MWTQRLTIPQQTTPQTPEEKHQQALVTASVFIETNRAHVRKAMEQYESVANSNYWTYGYMGTVMMSTMAGCLTLGNRFPFFRSYASWISLASGYFGGRAVLGVHNSYNMANVVKVINESVTETNKMDEQNGFAIPDYAREAAALKRMKYDLMPYTTEALEARKADMHNMSLSDRADALVEAYTKRKEAAQHK